MAGVSMKCSQCSKECLLQGMRRNKFLIATLIGVSCGIFLGLTLRYSGTSKENLVWLSIWGELFLRMLSLIILPLMISCLVTGISSMEATTGGKLGFVTLIYIISSQLISVTIAAVCTLTIKPGSKWATEVNNSLTDSTDGKVNQVYYDDIATDFLRNLFPDNFVTACLQNTYTERTYIISDKYGLNKTEVISEVKYRDGTNLLGIIVISMAVGLAISAAGKEGKPLLSMFKSLEKVVMNLMLVIIWYSPFAIVSLVASAIVGITDLSGVLASVGLHIVNFVLIAFIHQFMFAPLVYLIFTRKNPFVYYFHLLDGIIAGFAPPSTMAGLSFFMDSCKTKLGIDPRVADFMLPVAVTTYRDGSAMFIATTSLFIAQTRHIDLGFANVALVCILTGFLASAIPPIPSASLMLIMTVTSAVNIPIGDRMAVILSLEWLMDRIRSTNNLASIGYGCAVIDKLCKKHLTNGSETEKKEEQEITDGFM